MKDQKSSLLVLSFIVMSLTACGSDVTKKGQPPGNSFAGDDSGVMTDAAQDMGPDVERDAAADSGSSDEDMPAGQACIALSTEVIDFGLVSQDEARSHRLTIENCAENIPLSIRAIRLSAESDDAFALGSSRAMPPLTLAAGEATELQVQFSPSNAVEFTGELIIESDASTGPTTLVPLVGEGTSLECPTAVAEVSGGPNNTGLVIQVPPQVDVTLDGTMSYGPAGGAVDGYEWTIVDKPEGSIAIMEPSARGAQPTFFIDVAGTYVFELVVQSDGVASCGEAATVEVRAKPQTDIHIELIWDTPTDGNQLDTTGTDVDLHYLHPNGIWNSDGDWSLYWRYPTRTWDGGPAEFLREDRDGFGPEIVTHDNAMPGYTYQVGVYYYDDKGFGPSYATLRVYLNGELEFEYRDQFLPQTGTFWHAGSIDWSAKSVVLRNMSTTGFPTN